MPLYMELYNTPSPSVLTCYLTSPVEQRQTDVVLTLAAGDTIEETKVRSIPQYLKPKETNLKHLMELDPRSHLFKRVPRLGLPSLLTSYLI